MENSKKYLLFLLLITTGCNGWNTESYYRRFVDGKLSESLREEYQEKYVNEWEEFRKNHTQQELFSRKDYIDLYSYYKKETDSWKLKDSQHKEYCVYSLSYFIPLNFWNFRLTNEQYVKKAINDLSEEKYKGKNMKHIKIENDGFGSPLFSYFCIKILGEYGK